MGGGAKARARPGREIPLLRVRRKKPASIPITAAKCAHPVVHSSGDFSTFSFELSFIKKICRRSVQSKYYEIFECNKDKSCLVIAQTRKNCQFCRFRNCLESGMK